MLSHKQPNLGPQTCCISRTDCNLLGLITPSISKSLSELLDIQKFALGAQCSLNVLQSQML